MLTTVDTGVGWIAGEGLSGDECQVIHAVRVDECAS
jgi:hypothetical protein